MLNALHIVVPVTVHQVGHQTACGFGQVGGVLLDDIMEGDGLQEDHAATVGRELEPFHGPIGMAHLLAVAAVAVHAPHLTAFEEDDAVAQPCRVGLVVCILGEQLLSGTIAVDEVEHLVALVLLHAVIAYLIDDFIASGAGCIAADAAHGPESLRGEQVALQGDVAFAYVHFLLCFHWHPNHQGEGCRHDQ